MRVFALLLIVITISSFSCKKSAITDYPIDANLKAAFNYQSGSYWIYRDSITGRIDSFSIRGNQFTFGPNNANNSANANYAFDQVGMYMCEYTINSFDSSNWVIVIAGNTESLEWDNLFNIDSLFSYPFNIGRQIRNGDTGLTTNIFPTYLLNGQTFETVAEINHYTGYYNDWFYVCADAGIIKMRLRHPLNSINVVWELQRYHLIK